MISITGGMRQRENAGGTGAAFSKAAKTRRQVVKVAFDPGEADALIDRGYLEPNDRQDLEVLAAAVTAFFSDALMAP